MGAGYNAPREATPAQDAGVQRVIRVSGYPSKIFVYGKFSDQVENALADDWLSQAEKRQLDALPKRNVKLEGDVNELFAALTGYYAGTNGHLAKGEAHRRTYEGIKNSKYENLPEYRDPDRQNPYLMWLGRAVQWHLGKSQDAATMMIQSMVKLITAEPDIAPDDKMDLRGVQYLRALVELGVPPVGGGVTTTVFIGGIEVGPLLTTDVATYFILDGSKNYLGLIGQARMILNRFNVFVY